MPPAPPSRPPSARGSEQALPRGDAAPAQAAPERGLHPLVHCCLLSVTTGKGYLCPGRPPGPHAGDTPPRTGRLDRSVSCCSTEHTGQPALTAARLTSASYAWLPRRGGRSGPHRAPFSNTGEVSSSRDTGCTAVHTCPLPALTSPPPSSEAREMSILSHGHRSSDSQGDPPTPHAVASPLPSGLPLRCSTQS